jgi:hypothetical protein
LWGVSAGGEGFWSEIKRQPIKEAGLYFTSIGKWVKIKLS